MLILRRKKEEEIFIGDNIRIKVLRIEGGNNVSIGIDCPLNVRIVRDDAKNKKEKDNASN